MSTIHVPEVAAEVQTGGTPRVRAADVAVEVQTGGNSSARVAEAAVDVQTGGNPKLRVAFAGIEANTGGNPKIRVSLAAVEVLMLPQAEAPLMSTISLPVGGGSSGVSTALPGLSWSVHLRPQFSTRVASHVSGREIRAAFMQYPIYEIDLTFDVLRADIAHQELQTLMGFFLARQGQYDSFLLDLGAITFNAADDTATLQQIGDGDGGTTGFTLLRQTGGFVEPVGYVFPADLQGVYVNGGLADPSTYSYTPPNQLIFHSAPASGAVITASYFYYFNVRFAEDVNDFEAFMRNLWQLQTLKLQTVLV